MKLVLLDSSFLLLPFEKGIGIFGEISRVMSEGHGLAVPQAVINELEAMARGNGRRAIAAKSALAVIERKKIAIIGGKKVEVAANEEKKFAKAATGKNTAVGKENIMNADEWFFQNAKKMEAVVCTTDTELKERLRSQGVHVIILLDKSHLGFA